MAKAIEPFSKRVVEQYQDGFRVKCGRCRGRGAANGTCAVCNGNGAVTLSFPASQDGDVDVVRCGLCRGSGRDGGTCSVCNGVGVVVTGFPRVRCETCGGNGRWRRRGGRCNACDGLGSVRVESNAGDERREE